MSDTSNREQRTRRLGRVLASSFLGMFLGSLLSGVLQDVSDLFITLTVVSACHALCVLVVLCGVRETVCPDDVDENDHDFVKGDLVSSSSEERDEEEEGRKKVER